MDILLTCALGASTSALVNKMKSALEEDPELDSSDFSIEAVSTEDLEDHVKQNNVDVMLLGPQIRYKKQELTEIYTKQGIKVEVINPQDYGTMKGANVLQTALELKEDN